LYKWFAEARIKVMRRHTPSNYTVEVTMLPSKTSTGGKFGDSALLGVFDYLYPEEVVAARVTRYDLACGCWCWLFLFCDFVFVDQICFRKMPKTDKLREKRLEAVMNLERAAAQIGIDPCNLSSIDHFCVLLAFFSLSHHVDVVGKRVNDYREPKKNERPTSTLTVLFFFQANNHNRSFVC
jgi:hypothetical protein